MRRQYIFAPEIAAFFGESYDTTVKRFRAGCYRGARGGGRGRKWSVSAKAANQAHNLPAGTFESVIAEADAEQPAS